MNEFSKYHPLISLIYFSAVILFAMFEENPICIAISAVCALAYSIMLTGRTAVKISLIGMLPLIILSALLNPIFNHSGVTVLGYFPDGNPLTFEAFIYGISASCRIAATVLWFLCFNTVMTSDKLTYLFGRILPSASLVLSMALRFVPKFAQQAKDISNAQRCIGFDISTGSPIARLKKGIPIFSALIGTALEGSVHTADSMKSRGWGRKRRTAFSIYRFDMRDCIMICTVCALTVFTVYSLAAGLIKTTYFPYFKTTKNTFTFIIYGTLCILPIITEITEVIRWKYLISKI